MTGLWNLVFVGLWIDTNQDIMIRNILRKLVTPLLSDGVNPFHDYPFGREPRANREAYLTIWERAKREPYPVIDEYEKKLRFHIEDEWFHALALHTQVVIKESEICYQHGRLLYTTLSDYVHQNGFSHVNILETGTARGFSSLCMAKALRDRNVEGKIATIDPLPHYVSMYWNCIDDNESEKSRAQLLSNYSDLITRYIWFLEGKSRDVLTRLELSRIHFAFLDGSHEYKDVKSEIDYVVPRQKKGDIIFFDDYQESYFPGIVKAVKELEANHSYRVNTIAVNEQRGYAIAETLG